MNVRQTRARVFMACAANSRLAMILLILVAAAAGVSLVLNHQSQLRLQEKDGVIHEQQEQINQLATENERLSNLVAQAAAPQASESGQSEELLRLRAEVTRLSGEHQELARLKSAVASQVSEKPIDAVGQAQGGDARELVGKVDLLKQALVRMPDRRIPEMQNLPEQAWLRVVLDKQRIETEGDIRDALSRLREQAKQSYCSSIAQALQKYVQANNGELPADFSQLKAYFNSPVEDALLQRYQMLRSGNVSGLQPNDMLVGEKAPVDPDYDVLYQIGLTSSKSQGVGTRSGQHGTMTWSSNTSAISTTSQ